MVFSQEEATSPLFVYKDIVLYLFIDICKFTGTSCITGNVVISSDVTGNVVISSDVTGNVVITSDVINVIQTISEIDLSGKIWVF